MPIGLPPNLMGLTVSGDVGGVTIYTDRYQRKISYEKSPPQKPPSEWQQMLRLNFGNSVRQYMALSAAEKARWELLADKANLCMTGQNLLIHVAMKNAFGLLDTLMQQTGVTVTPPAPEI